MGLRRKEIYAFLFLTHLPLSLPKATPSKHKANLEVAAYKVGRAYVSRLALRAGERYGLGKVNLPSNDLRSPMQPVIFHPKAQEIFAL